ncbi:hypothetical protein M378DRAFT_1006840 [Amanita muscaria Koide BX008]|uniref:Uncharacterized protein n=1 Tax=Amanita muscaria (strain Koide BX008) TaxID=946122 RepID=A0A0C2SZA2_AMAMK|nr:hypothetical protein M378DRAFT_1006840 [Amanita muscaria Koide BX008]
MKTRCDGIRLAGFIRLASSDARSNGLLVRRFCIAIATLVENLECTYTLSLVDSPDSNVRLIEFLAFSGGGDICFCIFRSYNYPWPVLPIMLGSAPDRTRPRTLDPCYISPVPLTR